jgi:hypothetical protein
MRKTIAMLAGLFLTMTACGGAESGRAAEGTVSRTIVQFRPDGSSEVKIDKISQAQQQAEVAARRQLVQQKSARSATGTATQAISADPDCVGADLWLFDDFNQTGSNEICFFGGGSATLADYMTAYCYGDMCFYETWTYHVRSYWAGVSPGSLWGYAGEFNGYEYFNAWQRVDTAGFWAQHSTQVNLDF